MTKVLYDTNIVLDLLLDRHPHATASAAALEIAEVGKVRGFVAAHAVTTIHYFLRKETGNTKAKQMLATLLRVLSVAVENDAVMQEALLSPSPDFEDAVTAAAVRFAGCDFIVTRDPKGFRGSPVKCFSPEGLLQYLITI